MQLLQKNVCNFIVLEVCPPQYCWQFLLLERYYRYIFVISYCMNKLQPNVSYRYTYVAWAQQIQIFYSGELTNIRVLLYTFCTESHFKQIKGFKKSLKYFQLYFFVFHFEVEIESGFFWSKW